jgi:pimeloyl-ACP methyl ester carboxylesterase
VRGFEDHWFEADGVELHYVEAGSGPLVIFYHGFPLFWFSFHHQLTALRDEFRVVAVDGPGVNLSEKPEDLSRYRLPALVAQLDALARHLAGDEPFQLVGHDWGGALAWSFAQARPERLRSVVGINAPPGNQLLHLLRTDPEQQRRSAYMWAMRSGEIHERMTANDGASVWKRAYAGLRELPHYTAEHDEVFRQGLAQPGAIDGGINWYRANIPALGEIEDADCWPAPEASTPVPALLVWGETDGTFVPSFIDDLHRYATNVTVRRIPDVGHSPMLEAPEEVNAILRDFLVR